MNRYYNPKISLTMVKNTVAKMDQSLEKEMARLAKLKKKRETRSSLVDFYKKSLMMNKHFKEDLASGSRYVPVLRFRIRIGSTHVNFGCKIYDINSPFRGSTGYKFFVCHYFITVKKNEENFSYQKLCMIICSPKLITTLDSDPNSKYILQD